MPAIPDAAHLSLISEIPVRLADVEEFLAGQVPARRHQGVREMNWQPKDLGLSYEEAAHGIQSAIAHEIGLGRKVITPKHMRTSIELSRADQGGLALLLIAKGVFTAEEYAEAMRLAANTELAMREAEHPGITFR